MRVLAIDPAVRNTGYAVLEGDPRKPTVLAFDVITIPARLPQSAALSAIRSHLVNVILQFKPDEVAVEGIIYVQSHQTAISMGAARAAALIAAADHGLAIYEYDHAALPRPMLEHPEVLVEVSLFHLINVPHGARA
jgi:crossover junction endodeoxyribonuclease RuvC